jgi:co-chaperonin GroES (HSP10)
MKLSPGLILAEPIPHATQSPGGVLLAVDTPFQLDEKQWRVLEVGPGRWVKRRGKGKRRFQPMEVAPGDRILVDAGMGSRFTFEDGTKRRIFDMDLVLMKW